MPSVHLLVIWLADRMNLLLIEEFNNTGHSLLKRQPPGSIISEYVFNFPKYFLLNIIYV